MKIGNFNLPVNSVAASAKGDIVYLGGSAELGLTPPTWIARAIGTNAQTCKVGLTDSYTKLLCHFDSATTGDKPTPAATGQVITYVGTAQVSTAQKKFGATSLLLDGDSDYVSLLDSDDWDFLNGDFTIDMWLYLNASVTNQVILGQFAFGPTKVWFLRIDTSALVIYATGKLDYRISWTPVIKTWYHIAVVRSGNTWLMFINGVSQTVTEVTPFSTTTGVEAPLVIGYNAEDVLYLNGYIDEIRISKGIARWTANFTPPTKAYTAGLGPTWVT